MNENIDLTKILDGCPEYTPFYSQVFGTVLFIRIETCLSGKYIVFALYDRGVFSVDSKGKYAIDNGSTELDCIVFPSKDQRDWSKFVRFWDKKSLDKPVAEKFDPKTLQPWDKILVRKVHSPHNISPWSCEYFSYINPNTPQLVNGISSRYEICIPYNDETKHLRGTTDDCPEYYKWWKVETRFWWEE